MKELGYGIAAFVGLRGAALAVGLTVVEIDPEQARAYLGDSLELSTALGDQGALDLVTAAGIAHVERFSAEI